jgi:hypothetical protein
MKTSVLAIFLLTFLMLPAQVDATNYKASCVNKFLNWISDFFQNNQVSGVSFFELRVVWVNFAYKMNSVDFKSEDCRILCVKSSNILLTSWPASRENLDFETKFVLFKMLKWSGFCKVKA